MGTLEMGLMVDLVLLDMIREDKFGAEVDPMWITQLSHWDRALSLQNQKESPEEVTTFNAFNTRMICCTSLCTSTERS
jgi:hypothetical protein